MFWSYETQLFVSGNIFCMMCLFRSLYFKTMLLLLFLGGQILLTCLLHIFLFCTNIFKCLFYMVGHKLMILLFIFCYFSSTLYFFLFFSFYLTFFFCSRIPPMANLCLIIMSLYTLFGCKF